jgi:uncharacterized damage-inducible protein DinB
MNRSELQKLYDYNAWSNRLTLDSLDAITAEELTAPMSGSFASIRDTLLHIIGAESIWSGRCVGDRKRGLFPAADFPDVAAFRARWPQLDDEIDGFLAGADEARLAEPITYTNRHGNTYTYATRDILINNVNHSSYHRGQIVTLLRQIGAKPAVTDYLVWIDASSPRR